MSSEISEVAKFLVDLSLTPTPKVHYNIFMNILLIDDQQMILKILKTALVKSGHAVTEAQDGKQGWDLFLDDPTTFDVIVTDVEMPILGGVELLKRLRDKEWDIPVILMTSYDDIQISIAALRLGAFDFLLKPFKPQELLTILNKLKEMQTNKTKPLEAIIGFNEDIRLSIQSHTKAIPGAVAFLQDRVRSFCQVHRIDLRNIGLCLHEALVNAVVHGNLEIASTVKNESPEAFEQLVRQRETLPEFASRQVQIVCQITPEHLKFEIQDQGAGFDPQHIEYVDPLKMLTTGRGILIITSFMDQVFWNQTGNCITMLKTFALCNSQVSRER